MNIKKTIVGLTLTLTMIPIYAWESKENGNVTEITLENNETALFGYGSLMSTEEGFAASSERKYDDRLLFPCCLNGYKRGWTLHVPLSYKMNCIDKDNNIFTSEKTTPLNIHQSEQDYLNGILAVILKSDLPNYDDRESHYNRVDITHQLQGVKITGGNVYVYVGKEEYFSEHVKTPQESVIEQDYLDIINDALDALGEDFKREYDKTTGPTPLYLVADCSWLDKALWQEYEAHQQEYEAWWQKDGAWWQEHKAWWQKDGAWWQKYEAHQQEYEALWQEHKAWWQEYKASSDALKTFSHKLKTISEKGGNTLKVKKDSEKDEYVIQCINCNQKLFQELTELIKDCKFSFLRVEHDIHTCEADNSCDYISI